LWVKAPPEERNEEAKHMATAARRRTSTSVSLAQRIAGGIVGGIVGGLVFGAMMAMMGMLPMVASVVGSKSALIGFLYHMFNSAIISALFGLIFGQLRACANRVRV
jgi:predicted lipid-binding transport protein (Tim44 family)